MAAALAKARIEQAIKSLPPRIQRFLNAHIHKGENFELKTELNSEYKERRKEAVKRVIANMTVGKDVSALFADVLKCMQTDDLELKKLVYLYLMNYAKSQPELVILAVNSFVKDSTDPNPLIRALAVRTMGCLRVLRIIDYLTEPLRLALRDSHPYVRKTAATCVAKMYDLSPHVTVSSGFLPLLYDLLSDKNPMVAASAVSALREIHNSSVEASSVSNQPAPSSTAIPLNPLILEKLLSALNDCTEWGQISILESLAEYKPQTSIEAESILDRITPRLSHANPAVVLAAVRVLILYLPFVLSAPAADSRAAAYVDPAYGQNQQQQQKQQQHMLLYLKKLVPPLVSLLSISNEVAYVALRNIDLLLQAPLPLPSPQDQSLLATNSNINSSNINVADNSSNSNNSAASPFVALFANDVRIFFCKYDDPQYVKLEKLEVLLKLTMQNNVMDVVQELEEYASDVDIVFARKAIRCIGGCALKLRTVAETCLNALATLIKTEVSHIVQEAVVITSVVLRRHPDLVIDGIIPLLCAQMEYATEDDTRVAILWAIGNYAPRLPNAEELLTSVVENFANHAVSVQLQLITAAVYCNIHRKNSSAVSSNASDQTQLTLSARVLNAVLQLAMASDHPDVRDRAYFYWRLISLPADTTVAALASSNIGSTASALSPVALVLGVLPPPIDHPAVVGRVVPKACAGGLIQHLGTLSSVRHELPNNSVYPGRAANLSSSANPEENEYYDDDAIKTVASGVAAYSTPASQMALPPGQHAAISAQVQAQPPPPPVVAANLLDLDFDAAAAVVVAADREAHVQSTMAQEVLPVLLAATNPASLGLEVRGILSNANTVKAERTLVLEFENKFGAGPASEFAIQFNTNTLGLVPAHGVADILGTVLQNSTSPRAHITLASNDALRSVPERLPAGTAAQAVLQVAVKCTLGIIYFNVQIPGAWLNQNDGFQANFQQNQWPNMSSSAPSQADKYEDLLS